MKASDIKPCASCGKGVMHNGLPFFWRIKLERMGMDMNEVHRAVGTEQLVGNVAVARALYDPVVAKPIHEGKEVLICETCAGDAHPPYWVMRLLGEDG